MGGFLPTAAMTALQVGLETAQQHAAASAQKAEVRARSRELDQARAIDEREKRDRLRRALSTQRARFSAQGLTQSGSSEAALSGLVAETDRQIADARNLTGLRVDRLGEQFDASKDRSLLAASGSLGRTALSGLQRNLSSVRLLDF